MSKELVTDELWEIIEPLLPPEPPKPRGGRPRVEARAALAGIIFVLKSGIPCVIVPQDMERALRFIAALRDGVPPEVRFERVVVD